MINNDSRLQFALGLGKEETRFPEFKQQQIQKSNFQKLEIRNMNEVPISFNLPSLRTVDHIKVKSVAMSTTGNVKSNFTYIISYLAEIKKKKNTNGNF